MFFTIYKTKMCIYNMGKRKLKNQNKGKVQK